MIFLQFVGSAIIAGSFGLTGLQPESSGSTTALDSVTMSAQEAVVFAPAAINLAVPRATTGIVVLASGKPKRAKRAYSKVRNGQNGLIVFLPSGTRAVPRQVYENHSTAKKFKVPKGYSKVWQDDRLNPRRAEQSLGGYTRMNLIWTDTVPRRLIDKNTGQDMTHRIPIPVITPYADNSGQ